MNLRTFLHIFTLFTSLSLLSIGGGNTVIPEMHRQAVRNYDWMTDNQFADIFAISQAAPGPSILIVTLIGYKAGLGAGWGQVSGILGAILATLAMMIPAGCLVYLVARVWENAKDSALRHAVEKGFAPLTVGLVLASGWVMSEAADHGWQAWILTGICTIIFTTTKVNPLIVVAVAGFIGWLGWI
ncbi:MAG: chromate transporter [Terrimicrobiaceae bacterium]|nr:chromate transporter [Terrimicrobiaceae bacterium]